MKADLHVCQAMLAFLCHKSGRSLSRGLRLARHDHFIKRPTYCVSESADPHSHVWVEGVDWILTGFIGFRVFRMGVWPKPGLFANNSIVASAISSFKTREQLIKECHLEGSLGGQLHALGAPQLVCPVATRCHELAHPCDFGLFFCTCYNDFCFLAFRFLFDFP